jgi:N,N'-diacetyllegionaminate synthase
MGIRTELFVCAETAFHHEGDLPFLLRLIDAAAERGAHGIKFQILIQADALLARSHPSFERLAACTLPAHAWQRAILHSVERGLKVVVLPLDLAAFEVVRAVRQHVAFLDIHSVLFHDEALMEVFRGCGLPIILGVGGRTLEEVDAKRAYFGDQLRVLMVGFQAFPTRIGDVRLERITALRDRYPDLAIGYADHSAPAHEDAVASNEWAYVLGARVFEKHITVEEGTSRLDSEAAVGPARFAVMCERLRRLHEEVLSPRGPNLFEFTASEQAYRDRQRVAIAARDLPAGHRLVPADLLFRMTGRPGGFSTLHEVVGTTLVRPLRVHAPVLAEDLGLGSSDGSNSSTT